MTQASQSTGDFKGDYLSVKMFGADPSGTTDSLPAFIAAQGALPVMPDRPLEGGGYARKGRIIVPPGTYLFSDTFHLSPWVTLEGLSHQAATIKWANGSATSGEKFLIETALAGFTGGGDPVPPMMNYTMNGNINHLFLDGNKATNPSGSGIHFRGAQVGGMRHLYVYGFGKRGIVAQGAYLVFDNIEVDNNSAGGFVLDDGSHDVLFTWLGTEGTNPDGSVLDSEGDPAAALWIYRSYNVTVGDVINERSYLPVKISGSANVRINQAFFNGNNPPEASVPVGCLIRADSFGNGSRGIEICKATAYLCTTAIVDKMVSPQYEVPGAPVLSGTCNVALDGVSVTRASGTPFVPAQVGQYFTIGSSWYIVSAYTDGDHVTLRDSAGEQTGSAFQWRPFVNNISYRQNFFFPKLISRTGAQLLYCDDDAINFQDALIRFKSCDSGINDIRGRQGAGANEFRIRSGYDKLALQGGQDDANPRDVIIRPGDTRPGLRIDPDGVAHFQGDVETEAPISYPINLKGQSGGVGTLQGNLNLGGAYHTTQLKTDYDDIRIQAGMNDGNPRTAVIQSGASGPKLEVNPASLKITGSLEVTGSLTVDGAITDLTALAARVTTLESAIIGKASSTHVHAHTHTHADPVAGVTSNPNVTNTGTPI